MQGRNLDAQRQPEACSDRGTTEQRRQPRFKIEVDITVSSRSCGTLKGHTVDISESGISALLRMEVPVGELVELNFTLPLGAVKILAVVRQQSAFRYGFQFVEANKIIQNACRHFEMERSLLGEL